MKMRLADLLRLDKVLKTARAALAEVEHTAALLRLTDDRRLDAQDKEWLDQLIQDEVRCSALLGKYDAWPQSEWPGGPSTGPESRTKLRWPNGHGLLSNRRYFTQAEIDEAKAAGLLQGDFCGSAEEP